VRRAGGLPFAARSPAAPPVPGATPGAEADEVQVTVGSRDVPGCHAAGQPFRANVDSRWGELVLHNTVTFYWRRGPDTDSLIVRVEGQTLEALLRPGQRFPDVTLHLPLGERSTDLKLTTFTFDRWGADGQACLVWAQPPGTPRPQRVVPWRGDEA
jgi:hypothetical protein